MCVCVRAWLYVEFNSINKETHYKCTHSERENKRAERNETERKKVTIHNCNHSKNRFSEEKRNV